MEEKDKQPVNVNSQPEQAAQPDADFSMPQSVESPETTDCAQETPTQETPEPSTVEQSDSAGGEQPEPQPLEPSETTNCEQENSNQETPDAQETPSPPKKRRSMRILGNIFLIAVIALGIWSLFGIVSEIEPAAGTSFLQILKNANPLFTVVLIAVVLLAMILDVFKFCIISKTVTGKFHVKTSAKTNFIGKYYDAVTPFATGGQPMQIYYLSTKGISGGNSSAMVLIRYVFSIMCWIILGAALMIAGSVKGVLNGVSGGNLLKIAGWIGIGVNLIVPTFVLLFLVVPKLMLKITVFVVKLGYKMKIVKNIEKTTARATKVVSDFKHAFKLMATSPAKFIILVAVCFCESALAFSLPYFIMKAFSCPVDGMALAVMSLNVFAVFGVSFIPTPGNSGVMEGMGALAFSVAAGTALIWSVLTWRLLAYYVYIIIGIIITIYDIVKKNAAHKRMKKQESDGSAQINR